MGSNLRSAFLAVISAAALYGCGGGESTPPPPPPPPVQASLSVLAGNPYGPGNVDGTGSAAAFQNPYGVVTDEAGNLYLTDTANDTIRKITPSGVVTTLAGTAGVVGTADGTGAAAQFNSPSGIAIDSAGTLYVIDSGTQTLRTITPQGVVSTLPGTMSGSGSGIAVDGSGNVYISDAPGDQILKRTPGGTLIVFAGNGSAGSSDGQGTAAQFQEPRGLAMDREGNLLVADWGNSAIRKITPAAQVTTIAAIPYPEAIGVDEVDNLYVTESYAAVVTKITPSGTVSTLAGTAGVIGNADGIGAAAQFNAPSGIALDNTGNAFVADTGNSAVRKITPTAQVSTFAGGYVAGYKDGAGMAAQFRTPYGLATDSAGTVYAVDSGNAAIRVITPDGGVTTRSQLPGNILHDSDDYGAGITVNAAGVLYFVEVKFEIEEFGPLFASYSMTLQNSSNLSVPLSSCSGVNDPCSFAANLVTDAQGNTYYTADQTINKVDKGGQVSVLAGAAGVAGSADGPGTSARFDQPWGIAMDAQANLYVTDAGNSTIRRITPDGAVSTIAGSAGVIGKNDGTGPAAQFNYPTGIAVDSAGNVYVADTGNNLIRKITPAGVVQTVVGQAGRMGFTAGMLPGALSRPIGLALFGRTLYTTNNNAIVQVNDIP